MNSLAPDYVQKTVKGFVAATWNGHVAENETEVVAFIHPRDPKLPVDVTWIVETRLAKTRAGSGTSPGFSLNVKLHLLHKTKERNNKPNTKATSTNPCVEEASWTS
jgi:hypothetical protein